MARPKYGPWLEPDGLLKIEAWARNGLTDEQISHNMGIDTSTLYVWKKNHSTISEALKRGKEVVDIIVENALFKTAIGGYETEEVTTVRVTDDETGESEMVEIRRVKKTQPPNTTAQIFWLKNRRPDLWRDKREQEVTTSNKNPLEALTPEELKKIIGDEDDDK